MQIEGLKRRRIRGATALTPALLLVVAGWLAVAMPAVAVEVPSLYTVEVPLDPADPDAQQNAYRTALDVVLVRITGSAAATESEELAGLFPNPARFVQQYRPGVDDTLVVSLDGPSIERILRESGATVWGPDRPLTIVWLAVDWGLGDREIVAAGETTGMPGDSRTIDRNQMLRERVEAVAERRGLPVVFPLLDVEDMRRIGFVDIWGGFDEPLLEASARYEAQSILVGRIRPEDPQPPRWTWYTGEQRFGWPGQPEEAIEQLADALAARDAISGNQEVETIELTISGISSMTAYGEVQRYLENLRGVDALVVKSASPGQITYDVQVQGGAERLDNALSISTLLDRRDSGYSVDGGGLPSYGGNQALKLEYQYRPPAPIPVAPGLTPIPGEES